MVFSRDFEERRHQIPDYIRKIEPIFGDAILSVAAGAEKLYLDGVNLYDVITHDFLAQLGSVVGHGLCYEAAALAMMILQKNPTARLVQGTGKYRANTEERTDHAWVEFEEQGVPFVVDFAWFGEEFCIPRIVHVDVVKSVVYHTCSYQHFWQMALSRQLYKICHDKKTSHILPWLYFYRSSEHEYGLGLENASEIVCRTKFAPTGEKEQYMYFLDHILNDHYCTLAKLDYVTT